MDLTEGLLDYKKAVDEFLLERNISVNIIDATGGAVFFIKP
jgi:hypothetical protein